MSPSQSLYLNLILAILKEKMCQLAGVFSMNITKKCYPPESKNWWSIQPFQRRNLMLPTTTTVSIEYLPLRHCANCFPMVNPIHLDSTLQGI